MTRTPTGRGQQVIMEFQILLLSIVMSGIYCDDSSLHHQETGHIAAYRCGQSQKPASISAFDIEHENGSPVGPLKNHESSNYSDGYKVKDGDSYILYLPQQTGIDLRLSFNCAIYTKEGNRKIPFTVFRAHGVEVFQGSVQDGKKKTFDEYITNGRDYFVLSRSEDGILHITQIQEAGEEVSTPTVTVESSTLGGSTQQMTTENPDVMPSYIEGNDEELKHTSKGVTYADSVVVGFFIGVGVTSVVVVLVLAVLVKKKQISFSFKKKDDAGDEVDRPTPRTYEYDAVENVISGS